MGAAVYDDSFDDLMRALDSNRLKSSNHYGVHPKNRKLHGRNRAPKDWQVAVVPKGDVGAHGKPCRKSWPDFLLSYCFKSWSDSDHALKIGIHDADQIS